MTIQEFEGLSPEQKRVAIANDVLLQLSVDVYKATAGTFMNERQLKNAAKVTGISSIQTLLLENKVKECRVCAIGACFLSVIKFTNKLDVAQLGNVSFEFFSDEENPISDEENPISAFDRLREYFSESQLILIESAFEGSNKNHDGIANYFEVLKAIDFGNDINYNDYLIMVEIMENIVNHGGEFIP